MKRDITLKEHLTRIAKANQKTSRQLGEEQYRKRMQKLARRRKKKEKVAR